ncbi:MAG TPA: 4-hydroxy-tetrahydrodipicolinate reductase [Peptococcaceae bacterium]|nr:MAG: 4-hydroxy-tetrahydrodipicolinate reductase [Moorella sp. 60_41]HBT47811.1 4-hydroxy-tetrahydrodipicolinate reductase [Peptococcaceae bacterium]
MRDKIRVVITGAAGKMGREMAKGLLASPRIELVGAVDVVKTGMDIGTLSGGGPAGVPITSDLRATLEATRPQVLVDFTVAEAALRNARVALEHGVRPVIGTTGIPAEDLAELHTFCEEKGLGSVVAPNFSLGAVLMMHFAQLAVRYFPQAEIIEMHHEEKRDAPSGTALKTAELMAEAQGQERVTEEGFPERLKGVRGGIHKGFHVHSLRLPGAVAHQEVIFGGCGQLLTIRHDTISREAFLPGLLLAIEKVLHLRGVVFGLEKLLDL